MTDKELNQRLDNIEFWANSILKEIAILKKPQSPQGQLTAAQKRKIKLKAASQEVRAKRTAFIEKKVREAKELK